MLPSTTSFSKFSVSILIISALILKSSILFILITFTKNEKKFFFLNDLKRFFFRKFKSMDE